MKKENDTSQSLKNFILVSICQLIFESDIYAEELYDYLTDPNETKNISNDENTTKIVLRFQKLAANFFNKQSDIPFKEILRPKNEFKVGATLNYHELGSRK